MDTRNNTIPGAGSAKETASFKIRPGLKNALKLEHSKQKGGGSFSKYLETIVEEYAKRKKIKDVDENGSNSAAAA